MSLTQQTKSPGSPVLNFFKEHLPNTKSVLHEVRSKLVDETTLVPSEQTHSSILGLLGTAFDYRARYYFDITPINKLVASQGADDLENRGGPPPLVEYYRSEFVPYLEKALARLQPTNKKLGEKEERELAQYCIVLAYFEQFYRTSAAIQHSPLIRLDHPQQSSVFESIEPYLLDDLCATSWLFHERCNDLFQRPFHLNPTFDGSSDVKGADADLIVDGRLIEMKSTTTPNLKASRFREWLYQLIGYALLDYSDTYQIKGMDFYFARQGIRIGWDLADLIVRLSDGPALPVDELRKQFKYMAT